MPSDLVERLRQQATICETCGAADGEHDRDDREAAALMRFEATLFRQAADEIERLRRYVEVQ